MLVLQESDYGPEVKSYALIEHLWIDRLATSGNCRERKLDTPIIFRPEDPSVVGSSE
jgi:hypothetical protein